MTKVELVKKISDERKIATRENTLAVIEAFMDITKKEIISGGEVTLRGFGTFKGKLRAAKIARNISKGTPVAIDAHYIPAFKPALEFKEEVSKVAVK